jgi:hypothetical protein
MTTKDNKNSAKSSNEFCCNICDYYTLRKYNFENHNKSKKHKNNVITTMNNGLIEKTSKIYKCKICEKNFNDRAGLWRHTKKCNNNVFLINPIENNEKNIDKDQLIMMLIKQNSELMKEQTNIKQIMVEQQNKMLEHHNIVLEIAKNGTHNTTNSHNKSFNLQFFLNETCKDAMNITDFVDSIKLQLSDLENVGKVGYVEGISNIITTNLKALDVTQRPVHCTDKKREVLYIKDENKWEKEDDDKNKLRKAIKRVASKNQRLLPKFKEAHPDCVKASSLFSDQYNKIIIESMGGSGDNDIEKEDKIIRNITKNVTIEK